LDAHLSLLDKTGCRKLLGPYERSPDRTSQSLVDQRDLRYGKVLPLEELLSPETVNSFPWDVSFNNIASEPFVVLHTSGSTGLPKHVSISHGLIASVDEQQGLPDVDGRSVTAREWANRSVYTALPPFHSAGINFFIYSVFQSTELVFGPSDQPPSLNTVEQILDSCAAEAGVMAPSLLAEVAMDENVLRKVSRWSSVTFGGGPLPQEAGDALWQQTKVLQILGSTETFNIPELAPRSVDEWQYHCYHPRLGMEFRPHSEGLYELVFVRDKEAARHQGAFWTFPDQDEYSMKDLYERHPSKPDIWLYRGRLDDIIVLSNGEKFNPTGAERIIAQSETVKSALIIGAAQEQPAVLVEPADIPGTEPEHRRAVVVQAVEQANVTLPAHAQIHETHIRVLDSPNTFLRSSKGEVRRAPTTDALSDVVAQVFHAADQNSVSSSGLDFSSEQSLRSSLTSVLSSDLLEGVQITENDNIFEFGLDSLRAMKLLRCIKSGLRDQGLGLSSSLSPRAIYQHPTALAMASMLMRALNGQAPGEDETEGALAEMQQMLDTFTGRVDSLEKNASNKLSPKSRVVILTGSTGSLGSYILDSLVRNSAVDKIVCLNRSGGNAHKQTKTNQSRGLCEDFSKVEFLECDVTKRRLGLEDEKYVELVRQSSHVIHNAWAVNFNLPLSSFNPQLEACCHLLELSHASPNNVETMFLSSVGAANNWANVHDGQVPETMLDDFRVSEAMGYAQSKQVAELLFAHASQQLDLSVIVCRIGQVAGPVQSEKGMWNRHEWFPSVLLSCNALGKVPEDLGAMDCIDWIPVDLLGDMLVQTILPDKDNVHLESMEQVSSPRAASADDSYSVNSSTSGSTSPSLDAKSSRTSLFSAPEPASTGSKPTFLHFLNPQKTHWRDIVHSLADQGDVQAQVVPYSEWHSALLEAAEKEDMAEGVPAVKLVEFFGEVGQPGAKRPNFCTSAAQERSVLLKDLSPVSLQWLGRWLQQWRMHETQSDMGRRNGTSKI